jgi:hypothetical protein
LTVAALVAAAISLGGCSADNNEVPTLGGESAPRGVSQEQLDLAAEQAAAAENLMKCLGGKGIESDGTGRVRPEGYEVDFVEVMPVPKSEEFLVVTGWGWVTESPQYQIDGRDYSVPQYIDGDTDLTAELLECVEASGYFIPEGEAADPRIEAQDKQMIADASNIWADCARSNGLPEVEDAKVVIDDYATVPGVLIPAHVDVALFRAVLEACPPLDPKTDFAGGNMIEEGDYVPVNPRIVFDLPADDPKRQELEAAVDARINAVFEGARE